MVGGHRYHPQGHKLYDPLDEVDGAWVGWWSHSVDNSKADDTSYYYVANHQVELLLSRVLLDVEPGAGDQVHREAVGHPHPGEQGLLEPSLCQVGEQHYGHPKLIPVV